MKVQFNGMSNYKLDLFKQKHYSRFRQFSEGYFETVVIRMQKLSG